MSLADGMAWEQEHGSVPYRMPAPPAEEPKPTLGLCTLEERKLWDAVYLAAIGKYRLEDAALVASGAVKRRRLAVGVY